jgi:hypothetical protein
MAGHTRYAGAARARYARATASDLRRADHGTCRRSLGLYSMVGVLFKNGSITLPE